MTNFSTHYGIFRRLLKLTLGNLKLILLILIILKKFKEFDL